MAPAHVFFDLDGTLTDPAPGIVASFQHAMAALDREPWPAARLRGLIGPPLLEAMKRVLETDDGPLLKRAIRHYREYFAVHGMFENRVYPGIFGALEALKERGVRLVVATSKPQMFADRIVDHFGLRRYLPRVYGAELSGERADKSELLAQALELEGLASVPGAPAVMVGDRQRDIVGAKKHEMLTVGVLWGYGTLQELGGARPNRLVIDVDDLAQVLFELLLSAR